MDPNSAIVDITADNIQTHLIDASRHRPVLVDFWASWCGPCKSLMPILERLAGEYRGAFLLAKVNIDEQQELAGQFGVRSVPTVKLVKGGEIVDEFMGAVPESEIRQFLANHVERESDRILDEVAQLLDNGELEQATERLQPLLASEGEDHAVILTRARLLHLQGDDGAARSAIEGLPYAVRESAPSQQLLMAIDLAEILKTTPDRETLQQRLEDNPDQSEIRFQLATRLQADGDMEGALEQLLTLMQYDRHFNDGIAQQSMIKIFHQLGDSDELTSRYRRRMASLIM